jgi:[ribosomal protein S5]-alanine N-acetyltransferase
MTTIHTERLKLLPLTFSQLELYLENQTALARSLGLVEDELDIDREFWQESSQDIKNFIFPMFAENPDKAAWFTLKLIIFQEEMRIAGGIGGGLPNEKGEVQIGYFIDKRYENRGFATEATQGLMQWIFQNPGAQAVIADTLKDGFASQRVLQKCGFVFQNETEEGNLRWRRER